MIFVTAIAVVIASVSVGAFLFRRDTERENRRRDAATLAGILREHGLRHLPDVLIDYSVGDYSGLATKVSHLVKLFSGDPQAVLAELGKSFDSVLAVKLKTSDGRAAITAKVTEAAKQLSL